MSQKRKKNKIKKEDNASKSKLVLKENLQSKDHGKILFQWQFPEYTKYNRSLTWYIISSLVVILFLIFSIKNADFLFIIVILLVVFIIYLEEIRSPMMLDFRLTEDGLEVGQNDFYPYKEISYFYIIYEPPEVKKVYFKFKKFFRPLLTVDLVDKNPIDIRRVLVQYIEEDLSQEDEPVSDKIGRELKL